MSLYLLHLEPGYKHAAHYLGFTPAAQVERRVLEHLSGGPKASPLVKATLQAGCRVNLVRTWTDEKATRTRERQMKNTKNVPDYCPICRERRRHPNQAHLPL